MKKLLSLLLTLIMILSLGAVLVSCGGDEEKDGSGKNISELTKEDWEEVVANANFENVTFSYKATFRSGYEEEGPHIGTYMLDGNKLSMDGEVLDEEFAVAARTWYLDSSLAIVENFDNFQYDKGDDSYKSVNDIVYNVSILDYDATITASNVTVKFDSDNNIAKIVCSMKQEFYDADFNEYKTYILDTEFEFSDYGTTVVE